MPSEQSYRDRHGKGVSLKDACNGFTPTFAPADISLNVTNFTTFLGTVNTANDLVDTLDSNYSTNATTRVALLVTIKETLTQALGYLKSNKAWKSEFATAKMIVDKVRGTRAPKPVTPPEGETPDETKKRNQGNQAFMEVEGHLRKFIGVCTGTPGFSPPAVEIQLGPQNGLLSQLASLNGFLSDTEQKLTTARNKRRALYDEEDEGLASKFQAVKEAVKGQYGFGSEQYATAKAIKW